LDENRDFYTGVDEVDEEPVCRVDQVQLVNVMS